jgi:PAS domain S-box-containing protein
MNQLPKIRKNDMDPNQSEIDSALFKRMIENARDLIYRYEFLPVRRFTYVNSAATQITGFTPEEHYADPDLGFKLVHPDDAHLLESIVVGKNLKDEPQIIRWVTKNGTTIWLEQKITPFYDEKGNLISLEGMARDITNRKMAEMSLRESEERFRALFENNHAAILVIEPDSGDIIDVNQSAVEFYGWSKDEFLHKKISDINTLSASEISLKMREILEKKNSHNFFVHRLRDETTRNVEVFTGLIPTAGKQLLYSIIYDITDRLNTEEQLNKRLLENEAATNVSRALREIESEEQLIPILLGKICENTKIPYIEIIMYDKLMGRFRPANRNDCSKNIGLINFSQQENIFTDVFKTRHPIFFTGKDSNPDKEAIILEGLIEGWHGVCYPFQTETTVLGVLLIVAPKDRSISPHDVKLLEILIDIGATAVQRLRMHDTLVNSYINLQSEIRIRKEAEEMLAREKEILSVSLLSIGEGIISTELDKSIAIFNPAAEAITGFSATEAVGKSIGTILQIIDPKTHLIIDDPIEYLSRIDRTRGPRTASHLPILVTKDGKRKLISAKISSITTSKNYKTGFIIIFDDRTEIERRNSQSSLSQKMEAIGQLAAGIAHEINTPIQYIGDNVNFLNRAFLSLKESNDNLINFIKLSQERNRTPEEYQELTSGPSANTYQHFVEEFPKAFEETLEGIERVRKIVLAIREFSHPSEKEKHPCDINHGILTTVTISRNEWKYHSELETNLDPKLPHVYCQIDEINQVLLNLIVNASQAIEEKIGKNAAVKGKILISTHKEKDRAIITIQDTGIGIPSHLLDRIYDPFFTTKVAGHGTGQGLSLAHNIIVNKHHGSIHVDSTPGVGTTFTIELPFNAEDNSAENE